MHQPIRMCISCRVRLNQEELFRFQCKNRQLLKFENSTGRSFYLCKNCLKGTKPLKQVTKLCGKKEEHREVLLKIVEEIAN
jgi:predicted RNA-binding protein YlxR (DUF448 family)